MRGLAFDVCLLSDPLFALDRVDVAFDLVSARPADFRVPVVLLVEARDAVVAFLASVVFALVFDVRFEVEDVERPPLAVCFFAINSSPFATFGKPRL